MTAITEIKISSAQKDDLREMIQSGKSFLACVAAVQKTTHISLNEAKNLLLKSGVYSEVELKSINNTIQTMMSEFKENE